MREALKREGRLWWSVMALTAIYLLFQVPLTESRWLRDMLGQTPFHSVEVESKVIDGLTMTVTGHMQKRRCQKVGDLLAYTIHGGTARVADFDHSAEPIGTPPDRPPSANQQWFGPWSITARHADPEYAELYVYHQCPEGLTKNLVFREVWAD